MTPLSLATDKLAEALALNPASNVHTVFEGEKLVNGKPTGVPCVVALVPTKLPDSLVKAYHLPVPQSVHVGNGEVPVDVQEAPVLFEGAPFRTLILRLESRDSWGPDLRIHGGASEHQRCFSPLCPGGVQISPRGASHVGTLGLPWTWIENGKQRFGFLTNRHVAGLDRVAGDLCCQPHGNTKPIARLVKFNEFRLDGPNELDVALYDAEIDGKHYVRRGELFDLGKLTPGLTRFAVRDPAEKTGRTTGVTQGACEGVRGATTVNYGPGRNVQVQGVEFFRGYRGDFSAPGDSGSAIVKRGEGGYQFGSLLFAGGNGMTIGIPAETVAGFVGGSVFA